MAFNFPNSPTEGQVFAPSGGPTYVYNNPVWRAMGQGQIAIISDAAPASPANGQLWLESDTGLLFCYWNDGNSSQWVQVGGNVAPLITSAEAKNRIVNGAMQISQENGTTGGTTNVYYMADQWFSLFNLSTGVVTAARAYTTSSGAAARYRIRLLVSTAQASMAAGNYSIMQSIIEGIRVSDFDWGLASAKPAVLRFTVYAVQAGTYAVSIRDNPAAPTLSFVAPFTISAGEVNTYVDRTIVIPAPTSGTFALDNTASFTLSFTFAAGSTFQTATTNAWTAGNFLASTGISNGLAAVSNQINIANVGLYLDPQSTGVAPAWQMPDEAEELRACQRYYQRYITTLFNSNVTSAGVYRTMASLPVKMRADPSLSGTVAPGILAFPDAVGTLGLTNAKDSIMEYRTATATGIGLYASSLTANARM